ncbi:MAG TPA: hypothetical protein VMR33_06785 [Candidatus Baltobacteraceae bacterium]|jgi:hypothetical protein|nr:hypothetical protein [Candidatus Baltobacteraceae bacterium]
MKLIVFAVVALLAGAHMAAGASAESITFYLQLVQGTDADTAPAAGATLVGGALGHRLEMFRWKNYWEVKRQTVQLKTGAKSRRHMTRQRDIEIALPTPTDMTICIYLDGRLTRKRVQPVNTAFYIAGGDNDGAHSWFIVVRRDKPENSPATEVQSPLRDPHQRPFGQFVVERQ